MVGHDEELRMFPKSIDRRTILKLIGSLPLLGWVDPIRAIALSDLAIHYRASGDGRSIYKLLRDHIRNGMHYTDLERILGPFKLFGPADHDYFASAAPGYPDFAGVDISDGHLLVEYKMSYAVLVIEIRDGYLVNHEPDQFDEYPDGFVYRNGELEPITRPLDEEPLPIPPPRSNHTAENSQSDLDEYL